MIKKAYAVLHLTFSSEREADIICKSISPETKVTIRYRSRVKIARYGKRISLIFESRDTTALRASINSYLSWLRLLKSVYNFLESQK